MSVHSNHYDDPEEYERDLRYEYRTEQAGLYHYDDDEPTIPYCEDCLYCKEVMIWERKGRYVAPEYLDNEKWPDGKVNIYCDKYSNKIPITICTNVDGNKYMTEIEPDDTTCGEFERADDE